MVSERDGKRLAIEALRDANVEFGALLAVVRMEGPERTYWLVAFERPSDDGQDGFVGPIRVRVDTESGRSELVRSL